MRVGRPGPPFWDAPEGPYNLELKGRLGYAHLRFAYGSTHVLELGEVFVFSGMQNDAKLCALGHARLLPAEGFKPVACATCKRPFVNRDFLNMHVSREHERPASKKGAA